MKANKAPEKIYIFETDLQREDHRVMYGINQDNNIRGLVEYTQTDVLIEKAKEWFIEHVNIPQDVETNEDGEPLAGSYIKYAKARFEAANEMFENFKNYMKGE